MASKFAHTHYLSKTSVESARPKKSPRNLKASEVDYRTGFGKTKRNELIKQGKFPAPFQLAGVTTEKGRTNYWSESEIDAWIMDMQNVDRQSMMKVADNPLYSWMCNNQASKREAV